MSFPCRENHVISVRMRVDLIGDVQMASALQCSYTINDESIKRGSLSHLPTRYCWCSLSETSASFSRILRSEINLRRQNSLDNPVGNTSAEIFFHLNRTRHTDIPGKLVICEAA